MLERYYSAMPPTADGRFPQISGLCFTYDIALAAVPQVKAPFSEMPTARALQRPST